MMAILTAGELARVVPGGDPARLMAAASTLALLAGGFLLLGRILRLGFLSNFISDPVLTGLKTAAGLIIVVDQVPKMLGLHFVKGAFFGNILSIFKHVPASSVPTLILAVVMLVLLILMERYAPRVPAPLVAIVAQFLESFKEFPPRQKAASFTIDDVLAKMQEGATST